LKEYIIKRIISVIPILVIVALIVFFLVHLTPGDPAAVILGPAATITELERLRGEMGLDQPLLKQLLVWLSDILRGDLGRSLFMRKTVLEAFMDHLWSTLSLALGGQIIAIIIAIPLGIVAANRRGSRIDRAVSVFSTLGVSIPNFLLALIMVLVFSVGLSLLPVAGFRPLRMGLWTHVRYLILPTLTLGIIQAALLTRVTRSSMLEVLNSNYVKTAYAKGLRERTVIVKHAFRNAFIPILTVIGQSFTQLIVGAIVVEVVFNIPGIGQLLINAISRRDFQVIQGSILLIALTFILINLVIDLLYGLLDPRIRLNRK
jgi:peptide/nickel transport system permease protein